MTRHAEERGDHDQQQLPALGQPHVREWDDHEQRQCCHDEPHERQADDAKAGAATRMGGNALAHSMTTPTPAAITTPVGGTVERLAIGGQQVEGGDLLLVVG